MHTSLILSVFVKNLVLRIMNPQTRFLLKIGIDGNDYKVLVRIDIRLNSDVDLKDYPIVGR